MGSFGVDLGRREAPPQRGQCFLAQGMAEIEEQEAAGAEFAEGDNLFDGRVGAELAFVGGDAEARGSSVRSTLWLGLKLFSGRALSWHRAGPNNHLLHGMQGVNRHEANVWMASFKDPEYFICKCLSN